MPAGRRPSPSPAARRPCPRSRRPSGAIIRRCRTPAAVQALSQRDAVQHRAAARRRDAAQLPRRRPARHRALHGSGALGRRHPRTARLSSADPQLRIDRRARSRPVRLPPPRALGIDRPLARSGAARAQAGLPHARAPSRSPTSIRTSTTTAASPATPSSICGRCSAATTGGWRTGTCGRRSAPCSRRRIVRSRHRTRGSIGCGGSMSRSGRRTRTASRSTTDRQTWSALPRETGDASGRVAANWR